MIENNKQTYLFEIDDNNCVYLPKIENVPYNFAKAIPCDNPYCNCKQLTFVINTKNNINLENMKENVYLIFDILKQEIELITELEQKDTLIEAGYKMIDFFQENMTEYDWIQLIALEMILKNIAIEENTFPENYDYEFEKGELLDISSRMVFSDMFPGSMPLIFLDAQKEQCRVLEYYCKNPDCDCTTIQLSIYKTDKLHYDFDFDYKTGKIVEGVDKFAAITRIQMQTKDSLQKRFETRNKLIRNVTKKALSNLELTDDFDWYNNESRIEDTPLLYGAKEPIFKKKVGRNAPCPCGSGKKYKRCCLKK